MDIVVTLPLSVGLAAWIAEGDAAGDPPTGEHYGFWVGGVRPKIEPGERVYVVHRGKLRGYAPLVRVDPVDGFVRAGGAVAVTVPFEIPGFRGFRYRWWDLSYEIPFPDWRTP